MFDEKLSYSSQGDIMDNKEFKLPVINEEMKKKLIDSMSHVRWVHRVTISFIENILRIIYQEGHQDWRRSSII